MVLGLIIGLAAGAAAGWWYGRRQMVARMSAETAAAWQRQK